MSARDPTVAATLEELLAVRRRRRSAGKSTNHYQSLPDFKISLNRERYVLINFEPK
jgi:hypothetical protein